MTTLTRRSAIAGLAAAAITLQPGHTSGASDPVDAPVAPFLSGIQPYGPEHPLAHGEILTAPVPNGVVELEEVSRRVAAHRLPLTSSDNDSAGDARGAEALLRDRLDDEAWRWCVREWVAYQQHLQHVADLLGEAERGDAGLVDAIEALGEAGTTLYLTATAHMLDLGLDVGKRIAHEHSPSVVFLPGDQFCPACHGAGDDGGRPCLRCGGEGLVAPGPVRVLIYIPDGLLEPEEGSAVA